jgi:anthranilate phosphoribosyltransferase
VNTFYLHPADVGINKSAPAALAGGDAAENAAIARAVLAGTPGAARDVVLINTAAALLVAGRATTLKEGIALAAEGIDSGRAAVTLEKLVACSREGAVVA